jgi:hypothetical protein
LAAFRALFGMTAGYGVRKKRPKYSDGQSLLNLNDVINVVLCPLQCDPGVSMDESDTCARPFQRFGVMDDGIDLAYDSSEGMLQIVLRYHKLVVTSESIQCLHSVGVALPVSTIVPRTESIVTTIIPGMEFMDGLYVMRIISVTDTEIHARQTYKVVHDRRTIRVTDPDVVVYTDVANVYQ